MAQHLPYPLKTIVLLGGKGTRLSSVTGDRIPKGFVEINKDKTIRGIEFLEAALHQAGITDIILSLGYYSEQYEAFAKGKPYEFFYQTPLSGTSGALEDVVNHYGYSYQYLVLSGDIYFDPRDVIKMLYEHTPNTITWGVMPLAYEQMEPYHGLVVDEKTKAIIGDVKSAWWK